MSLKSNFCHSTGLLHCYVIPAILKYLQCIFCIIILLILFTTYENSIAMSFSIVNLFFIQVDIFIISRTKNVPCTFLRLRRSLATSTLYAAVRILSGAFFVYLESTFLIYKKGPHHSLAESSLSSYTLNLYPTPQIVSIYCGCEVSYSIFSRIFLICTVTVAMSPIDSISQISRKSSSLLYT